MTKENFEKLKAAKTKEEAAEIIRTLGKKELSMQDLTGISGGREDSGSDRETIYWLLSQDMADVAWNYLQMNFDIDDSTKERMIKTYGYEGGVRYVVDKVLHLS